jgi:hypothetical protein
MNIQDIANALTIVRFVPDQGDRVETARNAQDTQTVREKQNAGETAQRMQAKERRDTYETMAFADRNALYDVADIRRRGGGHVLPRFQVVRKLTLEGDRIVAKLVDIVLAMERKSLRIYRKE